jgi:hypothetical protein
LTTLNSHQPASLPHPLIKDGSVDFDIGETSIGGDNKQGWEVKAGDEVDELLWVDNPGMRVGWVGDSCSEF